MRLAAGAALALLIPACGGAVASGAAVGKVGRGLSAHAEAVPAGGEVCTTQEALTTPPGAPEKPPSEACVKAGKKDELWRGSMVVLAAYGDMLETLASGSGTDTTGQLEAAQTGVRGTDWVDVEDGPDKAARTAVAQLVDQMNKNESKGDLEKTIQDAGPHVKAICDGLVPYLEAQARGLADIQKDLEKKRTSRADRRCGSLDNRAVCVSDSASDQVVYANAMGNLAALQRSHEDAHDAVAGFCAAHKKLEAAAEGGGLSSSETYGSVVDAVKSSRRARQSAAPADKAGAPPKK
ncbi:MAG: hypothetical protein IT372_01565 [Polyangiaceae bacterium]|nr:hypothetical protein [Polyangiaceae bacterium]